MPGPFSVSRRNFLKTVGVSSLAATVAGPVGSRGADSRGARRWTGRRGGPAHGERQAPRSEDRAARHAARRAAQRAPNMTGDKRVCDRGACGACTMHRRRPHASTRARRSRSRCRASRSAPSRGWPTARCCTRCSRPSATHDGLMCGFCTPGFVMAAVALLEKNPNPTRRAGEEGARRQHLPVRHLPAHPRSGVEGEGGDPWLTEPQQAPAAQAPVPAPTPAPPGRRKSTRGRRSRPLLGTSIKRLDGPDKVRAGRSTPTTSTVPGMLYARILRSPHPHARDRVDGSVSGGEGAGREGGARLEAAGKRR